MAHMRGARNISGQKLRPARRAFYAYIRQFGALLFAATLAVEYGRSTDTFSYWTLVLSFIYFQLPLKSRALAWFHPVTFLASFVTPAQYAFLLFAKPRVEYDRMELLDISITKVLVRSFLMYLAPLCLHGLDIALNRENLLVSYSLKPRKLMLAWTVLGYAMLEVCFFFLGGGGEYSQQGYDGGGGGEGVGTAGLEAVPAEYAGAARGVSAVVAVFAAVLLHLLLINEAYKMQS